MCAGWVGGWVHVWGVCVCMGGGYVWRVRVHVCRVGWVRGVMGGWVHMCVGWVGGWVHVCAGWVHVCGGWCVGACVWGCRCGY